MAKNAGKRLEGLSLLFRLAGISIIVLDATLMGETLYSGLNSGFRIYEIVVLSVAVLNILETINNWASIEQHICYYEHIALFVVDILTLGTFFVQVYVLFKIADSGGVSDITIRMKFVLATYILLYGLYWVWNHMIMKHEQVSDMLKKKISSVTKWRVGQVILGSVIFVVLLVLQVLGYLQYAKKWEYIWQIFTLFYLVASALILLFSQKLPEVLQTAMEAGHTA